MEIKYSRVRRVRPCLLLVHNTYIRMGQKSRISLRFRNSRQTPNESVAQVQASAFRIKLKPHPTVPARPYFYNFKYISCSYNLVIGLHLLPIGLRELGMATK